LQTSATLLFGVTAAISETEHHCSFTVHSEQQRSGGYDDSRSFKIIIIADAAWKLKLSLKTDALIVFDEDRSLLQSYIYTSVTMVALCVTESDHYISRTAFYFLQTLSAVSAL